MSNADGLPVFVMMTCLNGYFHDAALDSLAESLMKAEHGGAVAVWASTGMTSPMEQSVLNKRLYELFYDREHSRPGNDARRCDSGCEGGSERRRYSPNVGVARRSDNEAQVDRNRLAPRDSQASTNLFLWRIPAYF